MKRFALAAAGFLVAGCSHPAPQNGPAPHPVPKPSVDPGPYRTDQPVEVRHHPPPTARYTLYRRDSVAVQMPTGEAQVQTLGRTIYLTFIATPTGNDYQITFTADSIRLDQDAVFPQAMIDSAVGTQWTGRLDASGRLGELESSKPSLVGEQLRSHIRALFPSLPAAGATEGQSWTDSTTSTVKATTFDATEEAISLYRATGHEEVGGHPALRIEATRASKLSGGGNQFGQTLSLTGSGTTALVYDLGLNGVLLAVSGTEISELTITVEAVGQTVPAHQEARFTLSLMP